MSHCNFIVILSGRFSARQNHHMQLLRFHLHKSHNKHGFCTTFHILWLYFTNYMCKLWNCSKIFFWALRLSVCFWGLTKTTTYKNIICSSIEAMWFIAVATCIVPYWYLGLCGLRRGCDAKDSNQNFLKLQYNFMWNMFYAFIFSFFHNIKWLMNNSVQIGLHKMVLTEVWHYRAIKL